MAAEVGSEAPDFTLHDITGLKDRFEEGHAEVFGVSVDSPFALKAFKRDEGFGARLLSDFEPKGEVARQYDVYIDALGEARDQTEVVAALASCPV